jgi:hypothetical protein
MQGARGHIGEDIAGGSLEECCLSPLEKCIVDDV